MTIIVIVDIYSECLNWGAMLNIYMVYFPVILL